MHERISEALTSLVARARREGDLRRDFEISDLAVIYYMLGAAIDVTEDTRPGTWRRYLSLLLDVVRSSSERRSKFPAPALTRDEIERALTD